MRRQGTIGDRINIGFHRTSTQPDTDCIILSWVHGFLRHLNEKLSYAGPYRLLPISLCGQVYSWRRYEDCRLSLCGDSFAVPSFAIVGATLLAEWLPRMRPSTIIQRLGLAPGFSVHPSVLVPATRWLAYGDNVEENLPADQIVRCLGLQVNHTGSDVRILTGEAMSKKGSHGSMRAWWWQWKQLFKVRWTSSNHTNYLEMRMILLTFLWKSRNPNAVGKRWLHLEDSMVCLYILTKGRTSSRLLQPLCCKISAVLLFMEAMAMHGHVTSLENPTDAASRA